MTDSPAHALARALIAHLRGMLATPELDVAEAPARISGGFDTDIYTLRLRGAPRAFAGPLVLRVLRRPPLQER